MAAKVTLEHGKLVAYYSALPGKADQFVMQAAALGEGYVKVAIRDVGAVDTGNLLNSVQHQHTGPGTAYIYVGAEYAHYVNYGTWKMTARPYWEPALQRLQGELPKLAAQAFKP